MKQVDYDYAGIVFYIIILLYNLPVTCCSGKLITATDVHINSYTDVSSNNLHHAVKSQQFKLES